MTSQASAAGPGQLVDLLTRWATDTAWVEWLELGGPLGRGAEDTTRREWTFLACIAAGVRALVDLLAPFVAEHDLDQLLAAVRPPLRADR